MNIRILGAHALESTTTQFVSILVDGVLALDAGGLTQKLSLQEQEKIKAVLLTHSHADHIEGLAGLAMHAFLSNITIEVYAIADTITALTTHVFNSVIHPNFTRMPSPDKPALRFHTIKPNTTQNINDYSIFAFPVRHSVPSVGYQVTDQEGKSILYTGDTGPGLPSCWESISPSLLIVDCAVSDRWISGAPALGHMTPGLLKPELVKFRQGKGYLPPVVLVHMVPMLDEEKEIAKEAAQIAQELNTTIKLGYEGMEIDI